MTDKGNSTAYWFQLHFMGHSAATLELSYHRFLDWNFLPSEGLPAKLQARWNLYSRAGHLPSREKRRHHPLTMYLLLYKS